MISFVSYVQGIPPVRTSPQLIKGISPSNLKDPAWESFRFCIPIETPWSALHPAEKLTYSATYTLDGRPKRGESLPTEFKCIFFQREYLNVGAAFVEFYKLS